METKTPIEVERPPTERPPVVAPPSTGGGPWALWVGIIVALVVGGLVGYLIGWNLAPADTETVTTTDTVTETVAPPAYTTGSEVEAYVAFDGDTCTYAGPAEVSAGTRATFAYAAAAKGSSLIVWKVAPGTTYEQVTEAVDSRAADDPPPFLDYYKQAAPLDATQQSLTMPMLEGTYVVSCATNPETSTNDVFASTMIRVVPG